MIKKYFIISSLLLASTACHAMFEGGDDPEEAKKIAQARATKAALAEKGHRYDVSTRAVVSIRNYLDAPDGVITGALGVLRCFESFLGTDSRLSAYLKTGKTKDEKNERNALASIFQPKKDQTETPLDGIERHFYNERDTALENYLKAAAANRKYARGSEEERIAKFGKMRGAESYAVKRSQIQMSLANLVNVATGVLSSGLQQKKLNSMYRGLLEDMRSVYAEYQAQASQPVSEEVLAAIDYTEEYQSSGEVEAPARSDSRAAPALPPRECAAATPAGTVRQRLTLDQQRGFVQAFENLRREAESRGANVTAARAVAKGKEVAKPEPSSSSRKDKKGK